MNQEVVLSMTIEQKDLQFKIYESLIHHKDDPLKKQEVLNFYQSLLDDKLPALNKYINSLEVDAILQRKANNGQTALTIETIMKQALVIRDLKANNNTDILEKFQEIINNNQPKENQKKMAAQLTPEQEKLKGQYLKTIEYLGFNPTYHEPQITKNLLEGNLSFNTTDQAKTDKNIKYDIAFSLNSMANGKVSYKAENVSNGHKVAWPQLGCMPRKEMSEGLLTGGTVLATLNKKDGETYKAWVVIDKKNPPLTDEQANKLFDPSNKCVQTFSGNAKLPTQYFGHEMIKKDVAILLNGKAIDIVTVDFITGEKLMVNGLKVDFKPMPEGKNKFDFSYTEKKGTSEFVSKEELQIIKDSIKQGRVEPVKSLNEDELTQAQQAKNDKQTPSLLELSTDIDEEDEEPKKKKKNKIKA